MVRHLRLVADIGETPTPKGREDDPVYRAAVIAERLENTLRCNGFGDVDISMEVEIDRG